MFQIIPRVSNTGLKMTIGLHNIDAKLRELSIQSKENTSQMEHFMRHFKSNTRRSRQSEHTEPSRGPDRVATDILLFNELCQVKEELARLSATVSTLSDAFERTLRVASVREPPGTTTADVQTLLHAPERRSSDASDCSFCLPEISLDHDDHRR